MFRTKLVELEFSSALFFSRRGCTDRDRTFAAPCMGTKWWQRDASLQAAIFLVKQRWPPISSGHSMQGLQEACIQHGKMVAICCNCVKEYGKHWAHCEDDCQLLHCVKDCVCLLYYLVKMRKSGFRRPEYLPILRHQAQNQYLLHPPGESWGTRPGDGRESEILFLKTSWRRLWAIWPPRLVFEKCEIAVILCLSNVKVVSGIGGMNFVMQARKFYFLCAEMRCFKLGCSWRRRDVFFTQWDLQALSVNVIVYWFWESTQMSLQSIALFSWFLLRYSPSACDRSGKVYLEMHAASASA